MINLEIFLNEYKTQLEISHKNNPEEYIWPISQLDTVFGRMKAAIIRGNFNKDSKAFKATCKALKIKHTYRDVENFIGK